ncbi:MAG: hypothetical protein CSA96_08180 [Bacteroidetes bacterium]|nr:MAG: hypothetical protein CSA96_08180 [Bacteroidota bacterium]
MKNRFLASLCLGFCLAFSLNTSAQPAGFNKLYHAYKGEEGVVALRIPGCLIRLAGNIGDLDGPERHLLRCLRSVTVLSIDERQLYPGLNFADELKLDAMNENYRLMMEVHDEQEDVIVAAREHRGRITDLIVVVGGSDNVLVHIKGRLRHDMLGSLANVAGIDKFPFTSEI